MSTITHDIEPKTYNTSVWDFLAQNVNIDWQLVALILNDLYIYEPKS